ncbi:MAG: hypothetical protein IPI65_06330 [Bacteroidetes bacterium]|nr:hypothetical protein [Bacteroidota bacterium]
MTGELDVYDLVPDSLSEINDDESVTIVYQSQLLNYNLTEEAIEIPDTSVEYFVSLDSLALDDQTVSVRLSLGNIAIDLGVSNWVLYYCIKRLRNYAGPDLRLSTDPTPVDATTFFETATFNAGYLDLSIANGLPVDLDTVVFKLTNSVGGETILEDTFSYSCCGFL